MALDPITLEIVWNRLIAATDEAAAVLVRTSFSTNIREANDFACVLMDTGGHSVAENSIGIPSFVGILPITVGAMLRKFPPGAWQPGDVVITNDPWLATGHLPDVTIVLPVFHRDRLVGFAGNIAHAQDIGGTIFAADAREVYEEGLRIPITRLYRGGEPNATLFELLAANVRASDQVLGDLQTQIGSAEICAKRVVEILDDHGLGSLDDLAPQVQAASERAMREAIRAIPDGSYVGKIELDGYDVPTRLRAEVIITGEEITVDYTGSSGESERGINCVYNYTYAYTAYPLKCAIDPNTPRNEGSYRPLRVVAPEGSIVNARFPAAVNARHLTCHFLYAALYQALAPAIPRAVIAECGSTPNLRMVVSGRTPSGRRFVDDPFANGGMGAGDGIDGLATTCFPSNRSANSVEWMERHTALVFLRKEFLTDSGGPGRFRGGVGQELAFRLETPYSATLSLLADRVSHPARGVFGGGTGSPAALMLADGTPLPSKGRSTLEPGAQVIVRCPGGGGYGPPEERSVERIERDVREGLVSPEAAQSIYGRGASGGARAADRD